MSTMCPSLPTESWLYILKEAITLEWREDMFFPPPDDFSQIAGFKAACKAFHHLVLKLMEAPLCISRWMLWGIGLERIRQLRMEGIISVKDFHLLLVSCSKLVSLSLSVFRPHLPDNYFSSKSLVRLDLTCEDVWGEVQSCRAPTLNFPNLRALRLASEDPLERMYDPQYRLYPDKFPTVLIKTVCKLDRLKHLSLHVSLSDRGIIRKIRKNHLNRHGCAVSNPPTPFMQCKLCIRKYKDTHEKLVRAREAELTLMLAEKLKELESVKWMDAWNESFYDEEGMRESRVVRKSDGKVSVFIDGESVPLVTQ